MRKLLLAALKAVYNYPFLPGVILVILFVLLARSPLCTAAEPPADAHKFMQGPAGAQRSTKYERTSAGFDREALAKATYLILRSDHSRMTYEDIRSTALFVIDEADKVGVDPFVALAVVFQESRFNNVKGDGGAACGIGQQHARYSIYFSTAPDRSVSKECRRLMHPRYAAKVLAHHLSIIQKRTSNLRRGVYQYNGAWSRRGQDWWHTHFKWRCLIEQAYDREVRQWDLDASLAADLRGSYRWWRRELASMNTKMRAVSAN